MMQIYFDGCSNTRCQGYMGDDTTKPSKEQRDYLYLRWSKKICDELGAEEYNFADSGASNHIILRNLAQVQYKGLKYFYLIRVIFDCLKRHLYFFQQKTFHLLSDQRLNRSRFYLLI